MVFLEYKHMVGHIGHQCVALGVVLGIGVHAFLDSFFGHLQVWFRFWRILVLASSGPFRFVRARHKHTVVAARGAAHLPKEGAQGACMNSHAVGPRSTKGG